MAWHARVVSKGRRWRSWGIPVIVGVACLGLGLFLGQKFDADTVGALGEWIGALGALAAVVAALYISSRDAEDARQRAIAEARERQERALSEGLAQQQRALVEANERQNRALLEAVERERRAAHAAKEEAVREASLVLGSLRAPEFDPHVNAEWIMVMKNYGAQPVLQPLLETFIHPTGGTTTWTFDDPAGFWEGYQVPDDIPPSGGSVQFARCGLVRPAADRGPAAEVGAGTSLQLHGHPRTSLAARRHVVACGGGSARHEFARWPGLVPVRSPGVAR